MHILRTTSKDDKDLRKAKLIIIDEVTMQTKDALRCIDRLLRDVINNRKRLRKSFSNGRRLWMNTSSCSQKVLGQKFYKTAFNQVNCEFYLKTYTF